jgi:hypothetical protein
MTATRWWAEGGSSKPVCGLANAQVSRPCGAWWQVRADTLQCMCRPLNSLSIGLMNRFGAVFIPPRAPRLPVGAYQFVHESSSISRFTWLTGIILERRETAVRHFVLVSGFRLLLKLGTFKVSRLGTIPDFARFADRAIRAVLPHALFRGTVHTNLAQVWATCYAS